MYVDFYPDKLYAPVASQETLRALVAFAASMDDIVKGVEIFVEGAHVTKAYLLGKLDKQIVMKQPTNFTCFLVKPVMVCLLEM